MFISRSAPRALPITLAILLLALPACQMTGTNGGTEPEPFSQATYSTNLDRDLASSGVRTLTIRTGEGSIQIFGEENRRSVELEGVIRTEATNIVEAKRIANEIDLTVTSERTENPVIQVTEPRITGSGQKYTYDLVVRVPPTVRVVLEDTGGSVEVVGLANGARVSSTSGKVEIANVRGGVELTTGGNEAQISDSGGRIQVQDGSGDLTIYAIQGDVHVEDTGGKLLIQHITGNVVASDNPLPVTVQNIRGDVDLINIPSSSVFQDVDGEIRIREEPRE